MIAIEAAGLFRGTPPPTAPAILPTFLWGRFLFTVHRTGLLVGQKSFRATETSCSFSGVSSLLALLVKRTLSSALALLLSQRRAPLCDSQAFPLCTRLIPFA